MKHLTTILGIVTLLFTGRMAAQGFSDTYAGDWEAHAMGWLLEAILMVSVHQLHKSTNKIKWISLVSLLVIVSSVSVYGGLAKKALQNSTKIQTAQKQIDLHLPRVHQLNAQIATQQNVMDSLPAQWVTRREQAEAKISTLTKALSGYQDEILAAHNTISTTNLNSGPVVWLADQMNLPRQQTVMVYTALLALCLGPLGSLLLTAGLKADTTVIPPKKVESTPKKKIIKKVKKETELKRFLRIHKMTQREAANILGVSPSSISRWSTGKAKISPARFEALQTDSKPVLKVV